jgi:hypothetical protein
MAEAIRRLHRQALRQGRGQALTRAFRQIVRRLEQEPDHFGEPAYHLPGLRMQVRRAIIRPLAVDFAGTEDHPLVFIKGVKLLSA